MSQPTGSVCNGSRRERRCRVFVRHARLWLALLAEILLLAALHRFDDWRYATMPIKFVETAVLCGIAFFAAASSFARVPLGRMAGVTFWVAAIVLRIVALPLEPGDDLWRYQWEGKVQNAGFNPYVLAPNDEQLTPIRAQFADWSQINHRDYSAIYPPGAELLFAALSRFGAGPLAYKLIFAAADLAAIAVLLRLIGGSTRFADAAWYAWNPLVVYSFAGAAHFDSLMILPMLVGILFFMRSQAATEPSARWRYAILGALAMGLAISIKLIPVLLLPVCVFALGRRALVARHQSGDSGDTQSAVWLPARRDLEFVRPFHLRDPPERHFLVDHRRHRLAESAPEKLSLQRDHHRRGAGRVGLLLPQLEARDCSG